MGRRGLGEPLGRGRLFHGWRVAGVAFLANLFSTGTIFYAFNAFLLPLCETRGWTRAQINVAPMLGFSLGIVAQYFYVSLIPRLGPRLLMVLGSLLSSAAYILMGRTQDLTAFYVFYVLTYLGNGAMGGIVANTVVSNWFVRKRGRALGLATAGLSVSGVLLPYPALLIQERLGLEAAFLVIGILVAGLAPLAWRVIRISPESCGLLPDGLPPEPGLAHVLGPSAENGSPESEWTTRETLAYPPFWKLGVAFCLTMMGAMGVGFQLAPRFQDLGFDASSALLLTSLTAAIATAGKFLWGLFCDLASPRKVIAGLLVAKALGLGLGAVFNTPLAVWLFIVVFGFAMGGVMSTFPVITAHIFGRASFPRVYRLLLLFLAFQGLGYFTMGQSFSLTGSYDAAYLCFLVADLAACVLVLSLPEGEGQRKSTGR